METLYKSLSRTPPLSREVSFSKGAWGSTPVGKLMLNNQNTLCLP
jgi:hypothetical protein